MKIAVLGAGLMGRAAVYDLAKNKDVTKIGLFEIDLKTAKAVAQKYGGKKTIAKKIDAGDTKNAARLFKQYDAVISAVTYRFNPGLAKAAIKAKAHFFDLGGNNTAVDAEFKLHAQAKKAGRLMNDALAFCCAGMGIKSKVGLKISVNATTPSVCGLIRPVILVPWKLTSTLGASRLRTILMHELAHIKRGDLWVNLAPWRVHI